MRNFHLFKRIYAALNKPKHRSINPISRVFGADRGTPIDRFYINSFLHANRALIKGVVMEISESTYSKKFGSNITAYEVLSNTDSNPHATVIGDLADHRTLPSNKVDCFICTQTLNFIYDYKAAVDGLHQILNNDGVALITVAGISQISRYDMERWGDYWRFTTLSMQKVFEDIFGEGNVTVDYYGNVFSSMSFLNGVAAEELAESELLAKDQDYQMIITIVAKKKIS